jgi:hypothetical protein
MGLRIQMLLATNTRTVIIAKGRTGRVILGAALFWAALLLLTACGGSGDSSSNGSSGGSSNGSSGGSEAIAEGGSASASASGDPISQSCNPPDMEGCYDKEDMKAYGNQIIPMVEQFFDTTLADMPHPKGYIYIPEGEVASSDCGNIRTDGGAYLTVPATIRYTWASPSYGCTTPRMVTPLRR